MTEKSFVVVFPSTFSQNKISLLMENIKKILKIKNQRYDSIRRDGGIIIIDANDPVFASSAINLLFGIKMVAIARQVKNDFKTVVSEISKIGGNLLLKGDNFYVKVEGEARGFLPKDLEMAATSSIIEKSSKLEVQPGTEENHDRLLYAFLTKSNAYVCIFLDRGLGGVPYGIHKETLICPVFDELSAVSCIETIKQGFGVKIIVFHTKDSELSNLVKMINQIIPRMVNEKVDLEFIRINFKRNSKNYHAYFQIIMEVVRRTSKEAGISRVSLPVSPLIFPSRMIESVLLDFIKEGIITYSPLGALEEEIYRNAREIGLGKFVSNIENLSRVNFTSEKFSQKTESMQERPSLVSVKIGPNNIHEILDQLTEEKKI